LPNCPRSFLEAQSSGAKPATAAASEAKTGEEESKSS
jgi:hypothetical protein